ncbi:MAG: methyltransferase domain-containing protein [Gammaproteobacteria bacterium]|nr:methyltransferase domain-containing protein [Gammaproteobacteria bacterium]
MKKFLHVGCGQKQKSATTKGFNTEDWLEIRYDIDSSVNPDYVGSMTNMRAIEDGGFDAVYSSHNIEHLYAHEVPKALVEFLRVLKGDGVVVLTCPDLKSICKVVAEDKLTEPVYHSAAGPIAPIDILYGHRASMESGNLFMAHKIGFTEKVLSGYFKDAGFANTVTRSRGAPYFDIWIIATKNENSNDKLREIAIEHFPA